MDKRYLEYILALAETGNMTRAAKKLYISQPTLSQFLSKQESEIGSPLFRRTNGTYVLTPVGELYAEYARKVLSLTDILEKDIRRISNTSRIKIGTSASRAVQMLTFILVDFCKYYPQVELTLSNGNLQLMNEAITGGEMDVAFVTVPSLAPWKGQSIELKKEEVVFAAPSSHPCCRHLDSDKPHSLDVSRLVEHFGSSPLILQLKGSCIRCLIDDFFEGQNFTPIVACNTSNAHSICDMIASRIGSGFIPADYTVGSSRITCFSLEPKMYRTHAILYRKDLILGAPHRRLFELAEKYAKEHWANLSE